MSQAQARGWSCVASARPLSLSLSKRGHEAGVTPPQAGAGFPGWGWRLEPFGNCRDQGLTSASGDEPAFSDAEDVGRGGGHGSAA